MCPYLPHKKQVITLGWRTYTTLIEGLWGFEDGWILLIWTFVTLLLLAYRLSAYIYETEIGAFYSYLSEWTLS